MMDKKDYAELFVKLLNEKKDEEPVKLVDQHEKLIIDLREAFKKAVIVSTPLPESFRIWKAQLQSALDFVLLTHKEMQAMLKLFSDHIGELDERVERLEKKE